jgi:hypothetical protein
MRQSVHPRTGWDSNGVIGLSLAFRIRGLATWASNCQPLEFLDGIEGETNHRLGIVALLYNKRKTSPHSPGISLLDLERQMGIPREYLDFRTWYLKNKQ